MSLREDFYQWEDFMLTRCEEVRNIMRHFEYGHLPAGNVRNASVSCATFAMKMVEEHRDGPELIAGLRKLLEAKDCFVRHAVVEEGTP